MIKLGKRGDTIVEVMLALAVLSLVLGGAYVSTNTSLRNTRQAQERGEALKITEQQLELLKAAYATGVDALNQPVNQPFCIYTNPATNNLDMKQIPVTNPAFPADYPTECKKDQGVLYGVYIKRSQPVTGPADSVFTLTTLWNHIGGDGQENLTMAYRL